MRGAKTVSGNPIRFGWPLHYRFAKLYRTKFTCMIDASAIEAAAIVPFGVSTELGGGWQPPWVVHMFTCG